MDKSKIKGTIIGFVLFALSVLLAHIYKIKMPLVENVIPLIGLALLIIISIVLFKSKHIFLFIVLGILLAFLGYSLLFVFWEPYPKFAILLFPIVLLLSAVFLCIGTLKIYKNFIKNLRK